MRVCVCVCVPIRADLLMSVGTRAVASRFRPASPHSPSFAIMDLDESLMNFVNVLGISIFVVIGLFHFVQSAAKQP